jgi:hypothetical protein
MQLREIKTRNNLPVDIICYLLIFLFVYTACSKLGGLRAFQQVISQSSFVKTNAVFISIAVPVAELLVSGLLFFNRSRIYGLWLSVALLTGFSLYILVMLLTMPDLPCSCGGVIGKLGWKGHIVFNGAFILLALAGIFFECYPVADRRAPIRYRNSN